MPEQLTKHPEVTLQVLRSGGADCGSAAAAPQILVQCPAERFCKLPGGELCVYGLADAPRMTQLDAADRQALAASLGGGAPALTGRDSAAAAGTTAAPAGVAEAWLGGGLGGLLAGALIGAALAARWRRRAR